MFTYNPAGNEGEFHPAQYSLQPHDSYLSLVLAENCCFGQCERLNGRREIVQCLKSIVIESANMR